MNTPPKAVQMLGVHKAFDGVAVLNDVDFEVGQGEVHALAGGNGAGKSTLMKILQGVYPMDEGAILVEGEPVQLASIHEARAAGSAWSSRSSAWSQPHRRPEHLPRRRTARPGRTDQRPRSRTAGPGGLRRDGGHGRPEAVVGELGTAYWQLTEIAKALAQNASVLIMDEPTASLARHETEALFDLVERLKARGISIIYISHRMDEVYRIADRITILRDGRRLLTEKLADVTPEQIVEGIVGKKIEGQLTYRHRGHDTDVAPLLEVRNLNAGPRVRGVSFTLRPGEILGLAGLMGSGRTELARALFGIDRVDSGEILLRGRKVSIDSPRQAIEEGFALIPEDRRAQGLVLEHSVRENLLLPMLDRTRKGVLLSSKAGKKLSSQLIERFAVKVANPQRPVRLLSGGNQQKVVLAKWLGTGPEVLILDEPTAGVDIGTKSEILDMIRGLADAGKAVIVISSEYPELLAVSDRILVLRDGTVVDDLDRGDVEDEESLQLAVQGVQS